MHRTITWLGCDLITGQKIEELPELQPSGPLTSVLATATSTQFSLPVPDPDRDWQAATVPRRTMIVPLLTVVNDDGLMVLDQEPLDAYIVLARRSGSESTAKLSCVSLAGYFDHRHVGDHAWVQQDESSVILAGLFDDADVEGVGFVVDAQPTGQLSDQSYFDADDKKVYSAARELMGRQDGPEWATSVGWADADHTTIAKYLRAGPRIGTASATPIAVFDSQGESAATYELVEDYSSGKGANHVVAVSSGQGESRPQSAPARDEEQLASGVPRWEHRFTPSTSISDPDTLTSHAVAALALLRQGSRALTLTARLDADPIVSRDWHIGDDIGYRLVGPGHPGGLVGVARCVGRSIDINAMTVSPILLLPGDEVI